MTAPSDRRHPFEELAEQFLERRRRGDAVAVEDFCAAHPGLDADIRRLFPTLLVLEGVGQAPTQASPAAPLPTDSTAALPRSFGEYRLLRVIGRGGMGVVYEAEQSLLGRRVAVKILPPAALDRPGARECFEREARAAAQLHHTHLVPVFAVGVADGVPFYTMQLIQGRGLDVVLRDAGACDWRTSARAVMQAAEALEAQRQVVAIQEKVVADAPDVPAYQDSLGVYHFNLANLLKAAGDQKAAEAAFRRAVEVLGALVEKHPGPSDYRSHLASALMNLGNPLWETGRAAEAQTMYERARDLLEKLTADFPEVPAYRSSLGGTLHNLALLEMARKDYDSARRLLEEAVVHQRDALKAAPGNPEARQFLRNHFAGLANVLLFQRDHAGAGRAAEDLAGVRPANAEDAYAASCFVARCISLASDDPKLSEAQRRQAAQAHADAAMRLLQATVQHGFTDRKRLLAEEYLEPLRERDDFQKLVSGLPAMP